MTIEVKATQLSNQSVQLLWSSDEADPLLFRIERAINPPSTIKVLAEVIGSTTAYIDQLDLAALVVGDVVAYSVIDQTTFTAGVAELTWADLDEPYTFGPVDPLADQIRYTTLDGVKQRMGIENTEADALITQAIIAAEVAIDQVNQRSLPDTGVNPEIPGIPQAIRNWASDASIAIWKAGDAPFGQGGGDAWLGSIDTQNITERILRRHPLALGYKVSWGVA